MANYGKLTGDIVKCSQCSKEYYVAPYRKHNTKFCSRRCLALSKITKEAQTCKVCNKLFLAIRSRLNTAKYCSPGCYHIGRKGWGTIKSICRHCGKEIVVSKRKNGQKQFCDVVCAGKAKRKKSTGEISTIRQAYLRRGLMVSCNLCGYSRRKKLLGIHHIDKNPENNSPDNLLVLCPNCHSEQHMKHIVHKTLHIEKKREEVIDAFNKICFEGSVQN